MDIMDVTLRESVYYGKGLSNADALEYLQILKRNIPNKYIQFVEIGYLNNDKCSPLNYDEDYFNKAIDTCRGTFNVTAMMHIPKSDMSKWNSEIVKKLSLVRVVVGQHVPDELKKYIDYFHALDVKISVNLTYVAGMTEETISYEIGRAKDMGVDYIFCADSSGSFSTETTKRICNLLNENCGSMVTGVHLHDHLQMALANSLIAKSSNIAMTDVSVTGAGKGGGNLKMEQGLLLLYEKENITYELLRGLSEMVRYFSQLIGRDYNFYLHNMTDFLTGVYRLSLKATDALELECGDDFELYFRKVTEQYLPYDVE